MITVRARSMPVIDRIVSRFVRPGSIIRTDCWRGYNNLVNLGLNYTHETVNHSIGFNINGIHTNTIEGN